MDEMEYQLSIGANSYEATLEVPTCPARLGFDLDIPDGCEDLATQLEASTA